MRERAHDRNGAKQIPSPGTQKGFLPEGRTLYGQEVGLCILSRSPVSPEAPLLVVRDSYPGTHAQEGVIRNHVASCG